MKKMNTVATPVVCLALLLMSGSQHPARGQEHSSQPALAGVWALNTERSDDPVEIMRAAEERRGSRRPSGGVGGIGGMGGGMGGGRGMGGGGATSPEQMREARALMIAALQPPPRLTITQGEGTVTFTDGDGVARTYAITNKKEKHPFAQRTVETKTRWDDGRLRQETDLTRDVKVTRVLSVVSPASGARELQVSLKLESPGGPVTMRWIYDDTARR